MLGLNRFFRDTWMFFVGTVRYTCLLMSALVVGCTALIGPDVPPVGSHFDLVGRMRIEAENSILRLDFHLVYDGSSTQLQVWGPMGINRTKVVLGEEYHTVENQRGDVVELRPTDLPKGVPASVWHIGSDLGRWLRLQPHEATESKVLDRWSLHGIDVEVEESQHVGGETVCKRIRLTSGAGEVLVLCDRWRLTQN